MKKFFYTLPLPTTTDIDALVKSKAVGSVYYASLDDAAIGVAKLQEQNKRNGYKYDYVILEAVKATEIPEPQPVKLVDLV